MATTRVTITDLEALISETGAEGNRLAALHANRSAASIDWQINPQDREQAASEAASAAREAASLKSANEALRTKLSDKIAAQENEAEAAERAESLAERDTLAATWAETWPRATAELLALFEATAKNEARLQASGLRREVNAEAKARNLPPNFNYRPELAKMQLFDLQGDLRIWPPIFTVWQ
jgi:hypothetical protein